MASIRYFGHAAFLLESRVSRILIDPFITDNPAAAGWSESQPPEVILVTHAHEDHLGDAIRLSQQWSVPILAINEIALYCTGQGATSVAANLGGVIPFGFGSVKLVPAWHSSSLGSNLRSLGVPCGFVIELHGERIYHSGDTALFGDMALIGDDAPLAVALLPIGGHYTMGAADAVRAVKLLRPQLVIPMHYNTWDVIRADPKVFKQRVEAETQSRCVVLAPGASYNTSATPEVSESPPGGAASCS